MKIKLSKKEECFILSAFGSGYRNYVALPSEMGIINNLLKKGVLERIPGYYRMVINDKTEHIVNNLNQQVLTK